VRYIVIGCGHPDRGDDAAGPLVARRLRAMGLNAREHLGDALSLIESWSGAGRVILVDAVVTGTAAGATGVWDGRDAPLIRDAMRGSTHALGLAETIELARALDRLPESLTIYGIEGADFGLGNAPSPAVLEAVDRVAAAIAATIEPKALNPS
jgi:hydrogenase maturation protease